MLLVASPYHQPLDPHEVATGKPYPPIGTLVSAAELRAAGHRVAAYDPMFTPDVNTFALALRGHQPRGVAIIADPHAVPVKMCLGSMRKAACEMVRMAKSEGANVLVSGPDPTDHPEVYRNAGADVVIVGEHDNAVLRWASQLEDSQHAVLPGGIWPREPVRTQLNSLPFPAFDLIDLAAYKRAWKRKYPVWELALSTARGCPYRCNWCAKPTWGRTYHAMSPERAVAQVHTLREQFSPDQLWFTDDIFAVKPAWLAEYRNRVGTNPVPFRCNTRADLVREGAYVADLAAAGCREVWMGAESGSDHVLAAMDKDQTRADINTAVARLRGAGIRVGFFLQLGYPGETSSDVESTLAMVRELAPDEIGVSVSYPLPGTEFHRRVAGELTKTNWASAMDNEVLFSSIYPQKYYDSVRELLRAEHALLSFRPHPGKAGLRRAAALPYHALRWPLHRARMAYFGR